MNVNEERGFNLGRALDEAQEVTGGGPTLAEQLDKGLAWLVGHYGWGTDAERTAYLDVREEWMAKAARHASRSELPIAAIACRLEVAEALLAGARDPVTATCADGATLPFRLCPKRADGKGAYELPCKLTLPEDPETGERAGVEHVRKPRGEADNEVGVLDVVDLLVVQQHFPGAPVVSVAEAKEKRSGLA